MSTTNNGGPAFPSHARAVTGDDGNTNYELHSAGMTLRDYFAASALLHIHYNPTGLPDDRVTAVTNMAARWAYRMADAMLVERAK